MRSGGLVALEALAQQPEIFGSVTLWDVPILHDEDRAQIRAHAPSRMPTWDGAHLANAWSRARDHFLFAPSYEHSYAARRQIDLPPAHILHDRVVDELHLSGALRPEVAVADHRIHAPAIGGLVKVVYTATSVHGEHAQRAAELFGDSNVTTRGDESWDEEVPTEIAAKPSFPARSSSAGSMNYTFAETSRGQLFARMSGEPTGKPLVLLHPSPRSARSLEPLLRALGKNRFVIGFDTLGNGESDKPAKPMASADYAKTVIEALDSLGIDEFDLYGSHTGATIAIEAAIAAPDRVGYPLGEFSDRAAGLIDAPTGVAELPADVPSAVELIERVLTKAWTGRLSQLAATR